MCTGVIAVCLAGFPILAVAQVQADEPIKTTFCELVKHPAQFGDKMVQVRATIVTGYEGIVIADDTCPGTIWLSVGEDRTSSAQEFAYIDHIMDIRNPDRLDWKPLPPLRTIILKRDREFRRLDKYFDKPRKYTVSAVCTGRFDHSDGKLIAIRAIGSRTVEAGPLRYGHMGDWDSQLVLQSVSNVIAKPIVRSEYKKTK
ncbi:MAG: hypothetical protein ACLP59_23005 [Bryobacteraceae bacterium]